MNFKFFNSINLKGITPYKNINNAKINYTHQDESNNVKKEITDVNEYNKLNKDSPGFTKKMGDSLLESANNMMTINQIYLDRLKNVNDYKQDNPNLSNIPLDGYTMGNSGCMISSLMASYYLYTGKSVDVTKFIKDIKRDNIWTMQTCGDADLLSDTTKTFATTNNWGLSCKKISVNEIISTLESGEKVLVNVTKDSPMGSGGPLDHYFLLDHINPETGEIYIYNPNSKYEGYQTLEFIEENALNYLNPIRNGLWAVEYNPNYKQLRQSASANQYNVPDFNYSNIDQTTLENLYSISQSSPLTGSTPNIDLGATSFKDVETFNQYIKDNVNTAGYGTRAGVIAAGLSLISGYNFIVGKRIRYSQELRQNDLCAEGIVNENFYLDCSSFAWWALYNGGFQIPKDKYGNEISAYTGSQITWSANEGTLKPLNEGKPGDYLVHHNSSGQHIVLIVGNYEGGYYCAELSSPQNGGIISKKNFTDLSVGGYQVMDMENYYSNSDNIR